jgi:hypothetical protein
MSISAVPGVCGFIVAARPQRIDRLVHQCSQHPLAISRVIILTLDRLNHASFRVWGDDSCNHHLS